MHAQELVRIEPAAQVAQGFLVQVHAIGPDANIIVVGLETRDRLHADDDDAIERSHRDALHGRRRTGWPDVDARKRRRRTAAGRGLVA